MHNNSNSVIEVTVVDYLGRKAGQSVEYVNLNKWAANLNIIGPEIVHPLHDIVLTADVKLNENYGGAENKPQLTVSQYFFVSEALVTEFVLFFARL